MSHMEPSLTVGLVPRSAQSSSNTQSPHYAWFAKTEEHQVRRFKILEPHIIAVRAVVTAAESKQY